MKGLAINKRFFFQVVKPLLDKKFGNLKYACGLLGPGSDVLGLDDLTSRDHNWGLRLFLFLQDENISKRNDLAEYLSKNLPDTFESIDVNWSEPAEDGSRTPEPTNGKVNHKIMIFTIQEYLQHHFNILDLDSLKPEQWLTLSEQKLLEFVSGEIFIDGFGKITELRKKMQYYPPIIKYINLLGEWNAIASEIAFIGRTRMLYDELGTHLITCRIINRLMRIGFILENQYTPYAKWIGSKFYYLPIAREVHSLFQQIIVSAEWEERENTLIECYLIYAREMKKSGLISKEIEEKFYYSRPQKVINVEDIISDLKTKINNEMADKYKWGSLNQIIAITDTIDSRDYLKNIFKLLSD